MTRDTASIQRTADGGLEVDHLFLSGAFNRFQAKAQGKDLVSFHTASNDLALTLAGSDGVWRSPVTGAFGGVAATASAPAREVFTLVDAASEWLRREGAQGVIRLPPDGLGGPGAAAMENALHRNGWRLAQVDLNYHLPVMAPADFFASLGETKQKEIRRLRRSGAEFQVLDCLEGERVYAVIAANRASRGYAMTMTWPQVAALAGAFEDRVGFHGVARAGQILAGAICLRITAAHRYVFYWGEDPAYRRESPTTLLAEGLMADCHAAGATTLDIGTSTDDSQPNPGLIAFKESLGCRTSAKRTYVLDPDRA